MWPFKRKKIEINEDYFANMFALMEDIIVPPKEISTILWSGKYAVRVKSYMATFNYPCNPYLHNEIGYLWKNEYGTVGLCDDIEEASKYYDQDTAIELYVEYLSQQERAPVTSISKGESDDI